MRRTKQQLQEILNLAYDYYISNKTTIKNCSILFNLDRHIFSKYLKQKGIKIIPNGKQDIDSNIFSKIDTEEKAYWLGFMYADGNLSSTTNHVSLELSLKDEEHLIKFNNFLSKSKNIRKDNLRCRCIFKDSKIYNDLISLGCMPKKSLVLKFPKSTQVPKNLIHHFVRGYVDGDGSIYVSNSNINISVLGTVEFLTKLIKVLNLPKRNLYKNNKQNNSNCYFFQYSGKNAISFINILYKDATVYLERKRKKYLEYEQQNQDTKRDS